MFEILDIKDSHKVNVSFGGKANSLSKLISLGYNSPKGFIVSAFFLKNYLSKMDIEFSTTSASEILNNKIPDEQYSLIREKIEEYDFNYWAIRSSYSKEDGKNNAWAGQFDSFLGVSSSNINDSIRKCWASLFSDRVVSYMQLSDVTMIEPEMNVICQELINSKISGIAFSIDPVGKDASNCIIESSYGLGELIVSGSIIPDTFVVEKNNSVIVEKELNEQTQKLTLIDGKVKLTNVNRNNLKRFSLDIDQIKQITKILKDLENYFGYYVDIEWCYDENDKFHLLQCRPITNL